MQSNAAKPVRAFNPSRYERAFNVRLVLKQLHETVTQFWLAERSGVQVCTVHVTPVQITHHNSGLWLAERQYKFSRLIKRWQNFVRKLWQTCSWMRKMASRKIKSFGTSSVWMFSGLYLLLIDNHTVLLVQFRINLHLWVLARVSFTKRWNSTRRSSLMCNFSFLKNLCKLILS